jgi:hypothetical protein
MKNLTLDKDCFDAGVMSDMDGNDAYRIIVLPDQIKKVNIHFAKEFAVNEGGKLPTSSELSYLFHNAKDLFDPEWYWSGEHNTVEDDFAASMHFESGIQTINYEYCKFNARVIRRLDI